MWVTHMVVSKKVNTRNRIKTKYGFAIAIIIVGIIFSFFDVGGHEFAGFPSLGIWIIFIGVNGIIIISFSLVSKRERIIDERMEHIGYKASRVTTLVFVLFLFAFMILDGIYTITLRYYLFSSSLICIYIFTYLIAYKIIERNC